MICIDWWQMKSDTINYNVMNQLILSSWILQLLVEVVINSTVLYLQVWKQLKKNMISKSNSLPHCSSCEFRQWNWRNELIVFDFTWKRSGRIKKDGWSNITIMSDYQLFCHVELNLYSMHILVNCILQYHQNITNGFYMNWQTQTLSFWGGQIGTEKKEKKKSMLFFKV